MSKIIIFSGYLAALKTTISKRIGEDFNILCLNKDTIKELLGDSIGFADREENLKLSRATFQIMKHIAVQEINLGNNVILESNFKPDEMMELNTSLNMHEEDILTLFLHGKANVLYDRYLKRDEKRHPVHKSTGFLSFEVFTKIMDEYSMDDCIGKVLDFDTTNFDENTYDSILNVISQHLKK